MSTIFSQTTPLVPLIDATIRVLSLKGRTTKKTSRYITAELLEFHPDLRERHRCIFRSYAYVKPHPELLLPEHAHLYQPCGEGYLGELYLRVNELYIHDEDVREMLTWCKIHALAPLIVHAYPLAYPIFHAGYR
ncbi:MAG: hypothetical protein E6J34_16915 [Chloroflexi bacterium]|nr:MAG: hypothetical protein E6J34_16915 [Chloroflexota bacterium]